MRGHRDCLGDQLCDGTRSDSCGFEAQFAYALRDARAKVGVVVRRWQRHRRRQRPGRPADRSSLRADGHCNRDDVGPARCGRGRTIRRQTGLMRERPDRHLQPPQDGRVGVGRRFHRGHQEIETDRVRARRARGQRRGNACAAAARANIASILVSAAPDCEDAATRASVNAPDASSVNTSTLESVGATRRLPDISGDSTSARPSAANGGPNVGSSSSVGSTDHRSMAASCCPRTPPTHVSVPSAALRPRASHR